MRSYGQFCPIAKAAELFCERWTPLIIRNLGAGAERFTDIHRGVPLMSATLLSQRLKQLEAEGLVTRTRGEGGRYWLYRLTEAGAEFLPLVGALGAWGRRWTRRELAEGEIDLGLLIWGLEFSVDAGAFGSRRTVIELTFPDQPRHKRRFWFVNAGGAVELCLHDPGHEVDIWLSAPLPEMIRLYRGDLTLAAALREERLEAHGPRNLLGQLGGWLNPGPLAAIPPAEVSPQPGAAGTVMPRNTPGRARNRSR